MTVPSWSEDGQTPAFLAVTRMATLPPVTVSLLLRNLGIKPGMRVLDVGCGSGEYTFRLGAQTEGVSFLGVDFDPGFVNFANARVQGAYGYPYEDLNHANSYTFLQADGLDLPFEDGTFDVVVSHTYLTALPDYIGALAEMCRVCKPGGKVSSITVMGEDFHGTGRMQLLPDMVSQEHADLINKVAEVASSTDAGMDLTSGIAPRKVPVSFAWMGLEDISCQPLGQYFCLSDSSLSREDYTRFVDLLHLMETQSVAQLQARGDGRITREEWQTYGEVLDARRQELLDSYGRNFEWDWFGSCALHVCGTVPAGGMFEVVETVKDALREARGWCRRLEETGAVFAQQTRQLHFGRSCRLTLTVDGVAQPAVFGMEPSQAQCLAYAQALGCLPEYGLLSVESLPYEAAVSLDPAPFDWGQVPLLWETASEATLQGYAISLHVVSSDDDQVKLACAVRHSRKEGSAAVAVAATDVILAAQLSCAYALGQLLLPA